MRGRGALAAGGLALCLSGALSLAVAPCLAAAPVDATPADTTSPPHKPAAAPATGPATAPATTPAARPAAAEEDIRDIRGPRLGLPPWLIPAVVAGLVALCLAGYAMVRWRRRAKRAPPLLPSEIALQRLEEIRALMRAERVREFSVAVSDVVRRYIEARFQVTAERRTTEEFLHHLLTAQDPVLVRHRGLLEEFLRQCDLAKFADVSLSAQNMETLHQSARVFVLETAATAVPAPGVTMPERLAAVS